MTRPTRYLAWMAAGLIAVAVLAALLHTQLYDAYRHNPALNFGIVIVFFIGTFYIFWQVWRINREISWIERFRTGQLESTNYRPPRLLAPMAVEMLAVTAAANTLGSWRLEGTTMYVTLEPCVMCSGAVFLARIARLVYATPDPKRGALGSVVNVSTNEAVNHHTEVDSGPMATECSLLLSSFFEELRRRARTE